MDKKHLDWLEKERTKKTFNLGEYDAKVTTDQIVIRGKTPQTWGRDIAFDQSNVKASITTESRTPMFIFYLAYTIYAFGFLMFFITSGITPTTQIVVFGFALILLFTPLILETLLPTKAFLIVTGFFFVGVFSLSKLEYLNLAFETVEGVVGKGHVEEFIIFASILPVLLRRMIGQMMTSYRLKLWDQSKAFEILTESPSPAALVEYLENGYRQRRFFRFPSFFLALSRKRMKSCQYCGDKTLVEYHRCHRPACDNHIEMLHGYKVCLDCFINRRGKIRRVLR